MRLLCKVYRSSAKEGMYLFVAADKGLDEVPDDLLRRFGAAVEAMTLLLNAERTLARADPVEVMGQIEEKGYYLQLPQVPGADMQQLAQRNDKLQR